MTFKKRFLMCLAIVGVLLVPSMAKAGDANALNKWMLEIPDSAEMVSGGTVTARFARVRGDGQSIKRNQKFYMAFFDVAGTTYVNANGTPTACDGVSTGDCVSAPLFIASETAILCMDSNINGEAKVASNTIRVSICADSTCTDATSIQYQEDLAENKYQSCGEGGASHTSQNRAAHSIGGQWIYVQVVAGVGGVVDDSKILVWVAGQ